ncbi:MAG: patatin-like phospholipase family protein [Desulfuromonadales bacterium]|nr:patatin-like phospholipase family protein [Desulfuromonadales bacterium]
MSRHLHQSSAFATPPRLGLALGSGAARGLAHIGVLKVLEEAETPVYGIAGTSIGAFIGALYAAGVPVQRMEAVACELDWRKLARLLNPTVPTSGLVDGRKLVEFMAELLPVHSFEALRLPLAVTATDIETGEALIIRKGDLLEALRAALAFPGIFPPVRFGDRFLVDGGLCNPVPADVVRHLGADRVIGICTIPDVDKQTPEAFMPRNRTSAEQGHHDLLSAAGIEQLFRRLFGSEHLPEVPVETNGRKVPGIFRVCAQSVAIMENQINALRLAENHHDLIIRPKCPGITLLEFHRAAEIIAAGEVAARTALPKIRQLAARH